MSFCKEFHYVFNMVFFETYRICIFRRILNLLKMKKLLLITILFTSLSYTNEASAQDAMLGEIRLFAGNFAPRGWALCEGQLLSISSNSALFSLLGTYYGGDGRTSFALPDLRGRVPVSPGTGPGLSPVKLGQKSNGKSVNEGDSGNAKTQSTLGLNYIICLQGFYPSRS